MSSDTYSREELARIFARAAELEADASPALPLRDSFSLSDAKAIAAEAGIAPELIERAAWDVRIAAESRRSGVVARRVETDFPTTLSKHRAAQVLAAVRSSIEEQGISESSPAGLSWRSEDGTLLMTVHETSGSTRLKVTSSAWRAVTGSGVLGVIAAFVAANVLEPLTMEVFFGSIAGGVAVGSALTTAAIARMRRRTARLLEAASGAMLAPESRDGDSDGSGYRV